MYNKIFVSIACFIDKDIVNTIEDCLLKSKFPNNIVFGICLQSFKDDNCLDKYRNNKQFKIKYINWKDAKGPTYARYLISQLVSDEKYFLQIDAHTRFFNNWDEKVINCLNECNDSYAILTAFPISIRRMDEKNIPLNISTKKFKSLSLDSIKLGSVYCSNNNFLKTYYLSAAFIFGPTDFLKEVPYDPYLIYSYQQIEQQFYAIRLFTYGWNLYKPSKHILATYYGKTIHKDTKGNIINVPYNNIKSLLSWKRVSYYYGLCNINNVELKQDIHLYGLGNKRTLDDYFAIHNESGCIDKIKKGLKYSNGTWHELKSNKEDIFQTLDKYNSKNIPLVVIDNNNNNFIDIKDQYNFNVHYFKKLKIDKDTYNNYIDKGLINTDRYKLRLEQVSTWISHLQI